MPTRARGSAPLPARGVLTSETEPHRAVGDDASPGATAGRSDGVRDARLACRARSGMRRADLHPRGHTRERPRTLEPVLRSTRTVRDVRVLRSWWTLAEYTVLARAGEAFDVIEAPTWLAVMATGRREFRDRLCPVSLTPAGVRILVEPGVVLRDELAGTRGVQVTATGSWVPMPPSRMLPGSVSWWIRPEQVSWRLGNADAVQDALAAVLAEAHHLPPSGAGGEAHAER